MIAHAVTCAAQLLYALRTLIDKERFWESLFYRLAFLMDFVEAWEVINFHRNELSSAALFCQMSFTNKALFYLYSVLSVCFLNHGVRCVPFLAIAAAGREIHNSTCILFSMLFQMFSSSYVILCNFFLVISQLKIKFFTLHFDTFQFLWPGEGECRGPLFCPEISKS